MVKTGLCTVAVYSKNHAVYNGENWTVYSRRVQQKPRSVLWWKRDCVQSQSTAKTMQCIMVKTGLCTVTEYSKAQAKRVYHYSGDSLWNFSCCKLYTSRLDHPGVIFLFPAQQNRQLLETGLLWLFDWLMMIDHLYSAILCPLEQTHCTRM